MQLSDLGPIIGWCASIASTLIITFFTAAINRKFDESKKESERKNQLREQEREEDRKWRASVDERLLSQAEWNEDRSNWFQWRDHIESEFAEQNKLTRVILELQCSQMRSDLIHRAHRYIDDLGCASTEEKNVFWAQYEDYQRLCKANDIENHFIDQLASRVMELPDRSKRQS